MKRSKKTYLFIFSEFELSTPLSIRVVVLSDIGEHSSGSNGFSLAELTWAEIIQLILLKRFNFCQFNEL